MHVIMMRKSRQQRHDISTIVGEDAPTLRGERKVKKLRIKFFKKKMQDCRQLFDNQTHGYIFWWTHLLMNRAVDSNHSELSTVFYRESIVDSSRSELSTAFYKEFGFVRVRVCCRHAPWVVNNMKFLGESEQVFEFVSDPNSKLLVSFSWGTSCLYKEG